MQTLWQDIRYGLRMLARNPGFSAVAVLTLALGIGANTAIFTVMNSVMLSALPVKDPGQLVALTNPDAHGMSNGSQDGNRNLLTYPEFQYMSSHNQVFSGVLAAQSGNDRQNVAVEGRGEGDGGSKASINMVSGSYFSVLGVNPVIGPDVWNRSGRRTRLECRGGDQQRVLEEPFRRRAYSGRVEDSNRQDSVHRDRRHAS